MKVRVLSEPIKAAGQFRSPGDEFEITDAAGKALIDAGFAEAAADSSVDQAAKEAAAKAAADKAAADKAAAEPGADPKGAAKVAPKQAQLPA